MGGLGGGGRAAIWQETLQVSFHALRLLLSEHGKSLLLLEGGGEKEEEEKEDKGSKTQQRSQQSKYAIQSLNLACKVLLLGDALMPGHLLDKALSILGFLKLVAPPPGS